VECKSRTVEYRAYGKVNLAMSVLGKRKDGYHNIATIMTSIQEYDVLTFCDRAQGIEVYCPALSGLPVEENLVYKAAKAIIGCACSSTGIYIKVDKNIPAGAGLGGGSSDAACTLLAVNQLLAPERRLSFDTLMKLAARIGADVPFFLGCNSLKPLWTAAVCTGIGHIVQPVEDPGLWLVLAVPNTYVSTRWAYDEFDRSGRQTPGKEVILPVEGHNDLEEVVSDSYQEIRLCKRYLLMAGAKWALMTGSGGGVYGVCKSYSHALNVKSKFMSLTAGVLPLRFISVTRTGRGSKND
jgi:4-diphosphocytidyl-2-C-methyl-D-erythritol kinase